MFLLSTANNVAAASAPQAFTLQVQTDNTGSSANNQFTYPCHPSTAIDFSIDWGDGESDTITSPTDPALTHTYAAPGTKTVRITGNSTSVYFNDNGDKLKLLSVDSWGDVDLVSLAFGFRGCDNLTFVADGAVRLPVSLNSTFRDCSALNSDLSNWDVSRASSMSNMFRSCSIFNSDLSNWDVSSAANMSNMFRSCSAFNSDLSNWDVSSAANMLRMLDATNLSTLNYSLLLVGWANQQLQTSVALGAGGITYSTDNTGDRTTDPAAARAYLESNFGWTITDGGLAA